MIGAGRVGTALAALLARAGHRVVAVSGREATAERARRFLPGVPVVAAEEAAARASVLLLGVPDERIREVSRALAGSIPAGTALVHLSGSAPLSEMDAAAGARPLSVHPLQSVPDVEAGIAAIPGSAAAVTARDDAGYALGERLASGAGAHPFRLPDERKPLYHAAAVFASSYLTVVEAVAERVFRRAGLAEPLPLYAPLARGTLDNVVRLGPAAALTGPAARGDADTVRRNVSALRAEVPEAAEAYVALARVALRLAEESGRLGREDRARVEEVLSAWR